MKKILVILSIVILCFSLVACQEFYEKRTDAASETNNETTDTTLDNNDETTDTTLENNDETTDTTLEDNDEEAAANEAILGTWIATGTDGFITFKENGVGEIGGFNETSFNWEYNKKWKYYSLYIPSDNNTKITNFMINRAKSSPVDYITINRCRFFSMNSSGIEEGNRIFEILSNSMEPFFNVGDFVLCEPIQDVKDLSVGDVISFTSNIGGTTVINSHRIVNIHEEEGNLFFETQGDACPFPDAEYRSESDILGRFTKILCSK